MSYPFHISVVTADLGHEVLMCLVHYLCFIVPYAAVLVLIHVFVRLPRELFRKMLHTAAFLSVPVIMWLSSSWQVSVLVLVAFGAIVWPLLALAEHAGWYEGLFVQRRTHEVRRSLLVMFWGNALVVALCWGACGNPQVAVASILMWGFGDAAAALVGKRWGRHKTGLPLADPKKTWEGSAAMFGVSLAIGLATITVAHGLSPATLLRVVLASLAGAYVELITKGGYDTITVPAANACVLLLLSVV